jgi:hypothetical protein
MAKAVKETGRQRRMRVYREYLEEYHRAINGQWWNGDIEKLNEKMDPIYDGMSEEDQLEMRRYAETLYLKRIV